MAASMRPAGCSPGPAFRIPAGSKASQTPRGTSPKESPTNIQEKGVFRLAQLEYMEMMMVAATSTAKLSGLR